MLTYNQPFSNYASMCSRGSEHIREPKPRFMALGSRKPMRNLAEAFRFQEQFIFVLFTFCKCCNDQIFLVQDNELNYENIFSSRLSS